MATIREMIKTDSGTYNLGPNMAGDLGLRDAGAVEALRSMQDAEPDQDWRAVEGFFGWGMVVGSCEGVLLAIDD